MSSPPPNGPQDPADALGVLAERLAQEQSVISPHVVQSDEHPALGALVAEGPRAAAAPGGYALVVEAIREGYLLHYGLPRIMRGHDSDLALLAGDYLYALGLSALAALDDQQAIRELSDLISLCARAHAEAADDPRRGDDLSAALWLAATVAVATGSGGLAARGADSALADGGAELVATARRSADREGLGDGIARAAESIGLRYSDWP